MRLTISQIIIEWDSVFFNLQDFLFCADDEAFYSDKWTTSIQKKAQLPSTMPAMAKVLYTELRYTIQVNYSSWHLQLTGLSHQQ